MRWILYRSVYLSNPGKFDMTAEIPVNDVKRIRINSTQRDRSTIYLGMELIRLLCIIQQACVTSACFMFSITLHKSSKRIKIKNSIRIIPVDVCPGTAFKKAALPDVKRSGIEAVIVLNCSNEEGPALAAIHTDESARAPQKTDPIITKMNHEIRLINR